MILFEARVRGITPVIMHSGLGIDQSTEIAREIKKITDKTVSKRSESDTTRLEMLESRRSLWLDASGLPTIPAAAVRRCIENAAKKAKEGPRVREGMLVASTAFEWDRAAVGDGSDLNALANAVKFTVPVVVSGRRIMRTRAKFDEWSLTFTIEADETLVEHYLLEQWIELGGRRVGYGDWRPEKSGTYGRYSLESLATV